jgi:hypothetical protein
MKIAILFCLFIVLLTSQIDKNGIHISLPDNWEGHWTLNDTVFKFKPDYLFSIGEGMLKKISESEYNSQIASIKKNIITYKINDYTVDKEIDTIDLYGESVNEFIALISSQKAIYEIKAYYEMSIAEDMENGLTDIIASLVIKN